MEYSRFLLFLLMAMLTACSSHKPKDSVRSISNKNEYITIDIDSAEEVEKLLCSSLMDPPKTIILESNKMCAIKQIHSIDIYENNIYILDDLSNKLYVFSFDGTFLYCFGHRGKGRGEYTEVSDFCIDKQGGYIYLLDPTMKTILKYNIRDREFITSVNIENGGYDSYSLLYFNNKLYVNRTSIEVNDDNYLISEIDEKSGKEICRYLKADEYNHKWNLPLRMQNGTFLSKNSSSPMFAELFTDTIIAFTPKGLESRYVINGKNIAKDREVENFINKCIIDKRYNLLDLDNHVICMPRHFLNIGDYLSFEMMSGGNIFYVLYNERTKEVLKAELFTNDYISSQCYVASNLIYSDENSVISVLNSDYIPYFIENIVSNGFLNRNINKYSELTQLTETSNPVLFYHAFKQTK